MIKYINATFMESKIKNILFNGNINFDIDTKRYHSNFFSQMKYISNYKINKSIIKRIISENSDIEMIHENIPKTIGIKEEKKELIFEKYLKEMKITISPEMLNINKKIEDFFEIFNIEIKNFSNEDVDKLKHSFQGYLIPKTQKILLRTNGRVYQDLFEKNINLSEIIYNVSKKINAFNTFDYYSSKEKEETFTNYKDFGKYILNKKDNYYYLNFYIDFDGNNKQSIELI